MKFVLILFHSPIGNAVTGLVFAKYIAQPFFPTGCEVPDSAVQLLAAAAICLLAFMNCCDIKFINKFINTFMFLKLTAVALVILGGGFAVFQSTVFFKEKINFFTFYLMVIN